MIVKDEEGSLGKCLSFARDIMDEIIIVDTGSADRTKHIASKYTDKIYDFKWIDDFSAARNYSFSKAEKDYILWLDADDLILPQDACLLKDLKSTLPEDVDAVMMKYNTGFDLQGKVTFSYYRERLVRRTRNFKWREPVHEYLETGGNVINSDICITHSKLVSQQSGRNLKIYESILAGGKALSPRSTYYYARELKDNGKYGDAARQFSLFLESGLGWVEDNITACGELAKCYSLQGDEDRALMAMLRSFVYDTPRAELCCQIGYHFKNKKNFKQAAFWFETALNIPQPKGSWGFIQQDCWGFIPSIECAVCYDNLGDYGKAEAYNEMAAGYKPDSPAVLYNRKYFNERKLLREMAENKEGKQ